MSKTNGLVYRINVAAEKLGVSRNTIYRLVQAGNLELVKISVRASAITAASITAHLEKQRPGEGRYGTIGDSTAP